MLGTLLCILRNEYITRCVTPSQNIYAGYLVISQNFQDLTGQIIRKVIALVQDVEQKLVKLVRITGNRLEEGTASQKGKEELAGPAIPGLDQGDQVTSQDDVDDLLSSLGF